MCVGRAQPMPAAAASSPERKPRLNVTGTRDYRLAQGAKHLAEDLVCSNEQLIVGSDRSNTETSP